MSSYHTPGYRNHRYSCTTVQLYWYTAVSRLYLSYSRFRPQPIDGSPESLRGHLSSMPGVLITVICSFLMTSLRATGTGTRWSSRVHRCKSLQIPLHSFNDTHGSLAHCRCCGRKHSASLARRGRTDRSDTKTPMVAHHPSRQSVTNLVRSTPIRYRYGAECLLVDLHVPGF